MPDISPKGTPQSGDSGDTGRKQGLERDPGHLAVPPAVLGVSVQDAYLHAFMGAVMSPTQGGI